MNIRQVCCSFVRLCSVCSSTALAAPPRRTTRRGPVKWVISFAAGGRERHRRPHHRAIPRRSKLGQNVVVENKGGAGGNIGMETVLARRPRRLHDRLRRAEQRHQRHALRQAAVNFVRDSSWVGGTMKLTNVMVVHPSVPAKTVASLSNTPRPTRARSTYASGGAGTPVHMSGELFKSDGRCEHGPRAVPRHGAGDAGCF